MGSPRSSFKQAGCGREIWNKTAKELKEEQRMKKKPKMKSGE